MLESIVRPVSAEHNPSEMVLVGIIFTMVSGLLVLQIGTSSPANTGLGLLLVAFISIPASPLLVNLFIIEGKKVRRNRSFPIPIIDRHDEVIKVLAFLFIGIIIGASILYLLLPGETAQFLFSDQLHDLSARGVNVMSGNAIARTDFWSLIENNTKVTLLVLVFSFVFGAGAIFIIAWNGTIIGVLIANIAQNPGRFGGIELLPGNPFVNYLAALPITFINLLPHGFFEF